MHSYGKVYNLGLGRTSHAQSFAGCRNGTSRNWQQNSSQTMSDGWIVIEKRMHTEFGYLFDRETGMGTFLTRERHEGEWYVPDNGCRVPVWAIVQIADKLMEDK